MTHGCYEYNSVINEIRAWSRKDIASNATMLYKDRFYSNTLFGPTREERYEYKTGGEPIVIDLGS